MRRSRKYNAVGWGILISLGGVIATVNWFKSLPVSTQIAFAAIAAFVVSAILLLMSAHWHERRRRRREYEQTLIDFRWREDMSPLEFERCCADYLGLIGWHAATTKGSGDQGADVIARKAGHSIVIQCKKYGKPVGNKAVQEVISARLFVGATQAVVVTNQNYTRAARELAVRANVLLLHFTDLKNIDQLCGEFREARKVARV